MEFLVLTSYFLHLHVFLKLLNKYAFNMGTFAVCKLYNNNVINLSVSKT